MKTDQPWPSQPEELNQNYVTLRADLAEFLKTLLVGDQPEGVPSDLLQTQIW